MHEGRKHERLELFERLCRQRGLALTIQRRAILEAALDDRGHPTADDLFEGVQRRIPGVSRTTVYRVLDTLVRNGLIAKVCHPGTAVRFDANTQQHHHLVCLDCNRIVDLDNDRLNALRLPAVDFQGFDVREFHIHFRGLCPQCRKKAPKPDRVKRTAGASGGGTVKQEALKPRSSRERKTR